MPIKLLQREISKPIEDQGPISTGGFYNLKRARSRFSEWENRYLQALSNFIPLKKGGKVESDLPSVERQR